MVKLIRDARPGRYPKGRRKGVVSLLFWLRVPHTLLKIFIMVKIQYSPHWIHFHTRIQLLPMIPLIWPKERVVRSEKNHTFGIVNYFNNYGYRKEK